jgi:hypothetical protein
MSKQGRVVSEQGRVMSTQGRVCKEEAKQTDSRPLLRRAESLIIGARRCKKKNKDVRKKLSKQTVGSAGSWRALCGSSGQVRPGWAAASGVGSRAARPDRL